ncbi:FHA domain-containing protein [Deinococcus hopiensis]|uniref:Forkhead associated (FHA) domain, binds pSer, pThr, pTyr n=1 Tax=Deinococcus hopiensis KR-140 TaxID=695939 RepID=A0A1W1UMA5_9DEIO|nr:FHA domain-containing protein [Deinococcus hopiensis]SMB81931.1 Forkhead associated (FHA) domain, binds pSer, pThr, pTyr [Deinococcus hopiensis KR-140]
MTVLCQVCGTANPEGTTYCEGCGVELPGATTSSPVPETAPETIPQAASSEAAGGTTDAAAPGAVALPSIAPSAETILPAERPVGPASGETAAEAAVTPVPEASTSGVSVSESAAPAAPAASVLTGEAKLGVKKFGAPTGESIPLQGDRLVVGRFDASSGPVDIDLSSLGGQEHISRRHAELYREQGVWSVRDLGSTNGVYIKRKGESGFSPRLQEPAALADGDELAFGNLMLIFHQG